MSAPNCARKYDIARLSSLNFQISQYVYLSLISLTFIFSYFAVKIVHQKSIFQLSTKILLFHNLVSANLHQLLYLFSALRRLNLAYFYIDEPCVPLISEADCLPYLKVLVTGISGMIYGQTGLLLERGCATFIKDYDKKTSMFVGIAISIAILFLSLITGKIIIWDDPLQGYLLSCVSYPSQSVERSRLFASIYTFISSFNLVFSVLLRRYNKKLEYSTPFVVGPRFRKREVIDSTSTICFLTFVQFIFMFIYSFGIFTLKTIRSMLTYRQYYFIVVWFYTIPFIAALFPILLVYRIRSSHVSRVTIIKTFTKTKQTQEEHIKQLKNVWN